MFEILQKKVYKTCIMDLDESKQQLKRNEPSWITSSLQQPFASGIVISSRSVMSVLYTVSLAVFHIHYNQSNSNLMNLDATVKVG